MKVIALNDDEIGLIVDALYSFSATSLRVDQAMVLGSKVQEAIHAQGFPVLVDSLTTHDALVEAGVDPSLVTDDEFVAQLSEEFSNDQSLASHIEEVAQAIAGEVGDED